jgi:hypothetical protein
MKKLLYLTAVVILTACILPHTAYAADDSATRQEAEEAIRDIKDLTSIEIQYNTDNYIDEAVNKQAAAINDYIEKHQLALAEIEHKFDMYYTILCIVTVILVIIPLICLISITKSFKKMASALNKLAETNENLLK